MARHDQRPDKSLMVCAKCKRNAECDQCVDVTRFKLRLNDPVCACGRTEHRKKVDDAVAA